MKYAKKFIVATSDDGYGALSFEKSYGLDDADEEETQQILQRVVTGIAFCGGKIVADEYEIYVMEFEPISKDAIEFFAGYIDYDAGKACNFYPVYETEYSRPDSNRGLPE